MNRVNYENDVDPWIRENKEGSWRDFMKANKKISISYYSYTKRRARVLGLQLPPSLRPDYKRPGCEPKVPKKSKESKSGQYSTLLTFPVQDFNNKSMVEAMSALIEKLNGALGLSLQWTQVEIMGSGIQLFELRNNQ